MNLARSGLDILIPFDYGFIFLHNDFELALDDCFKIAKNKLDYDIENNCDAIKHGWKIDEWVSLTDYFEQELIKSVGLKTAEKDRRKEYYDNYGKL